MKKSCHYGRTMWTAIFDGRSYIFMTTISMGEAGGYAPSPCGVLVLKFTKYSGISSTTTTFPSPCGGPSILASPVATGEVASMRADGGACALRTLLSLWMGYSLRSWRPLRHTACATSPALAGEAGGMLRPLAGSLYLSFPRRYGGSGEQREPMGALVPCVHF